MLSLVITALCLYLLATLFVACSQRHMIYHPTRLAGATLDSLARADGLDPWRRADGQRIGWKRLSQVRPAQGQVLITHGNAGCGVHRAHYATALQAAGALDVFILEYPGYGDRPGAPSEAALCAAGAEAFQALDPDRPVWLIGESLGSGVAAYLAGKDPRRVEGLLLIAPFDNLSDLAQHHMPVFPVRLILRDRFPSDEHLKGFKGPVGVLLAGQDEVVPSQFGRRLYDGYPGPKKLWEIPGASHNEVYRQPLTFWQEVVKFWTARAAD